MGEVNTPFPRLKLTVTKVEGVCYHGYKIGDELFLEDFTHPPKFFCLRFGACDFSGDIRFEFWRMFSF